jgi:PTS system nitrogen regulatory IIA component
VLQIIGDTKMYDFHQDLRVDCIFPKIKVRSKKDAYKILANECAWKIDISPDRFLSALLQNDEENNPVVGDGIAIPHLKLPDIKCRLKALMTFEEPVLFSGDGDAPVTILCLLVSPAIEGPAHLRRLARVSRLLRSRELQENLRVAKDEQAIKSLLALPEEWNMAA